MIRTAEFAEQPSFDFRDNFEDKGLTKRII